MKHEDYRRGGSLRDLAEEARLFLERLALTRDGVGDLTAALLVAERDGVAPDLTRLHALGEELTRLAYDLDATARMVCEATCVKLCCTRRTCERRATTYWASEGGWLCDAHALPGWTSSSDEWKSP